jgi:hypothetical protein
MGCVLFDPKQVALSGETSDIKTSPQGFLSLLKTPPHVKGSVNLVLISSKLGAAVFFVVLFLERLASSSSFT